MTHCVKYVAVCRAVVTLDAALARFIGRYPRSRHDGNSLTIDHDILITRLSSIDGGRSQWLGGGTMASAEHEPITGSGGRAPSGVQGQNFRDRTPGQGGFAP